MKTIIFTSFLICCSICNGQNMDSTNIKPVAVAGLDQVISLGTKVTKLEGNGIDMDGTIVSYLWTQIYGETVVIDNHIMAKITVKGFKDFGHYIFKFTVTDNLGNTDSDNVMIIVDKNRK